MTEMAASAIHPFTTDVYIKSLHNEAYMKKLQESEEFIIPKEENSPLKKLPPRSKTQYSPGRKSRTFQGKSSRLNEREDTPPYAPQQLLEDLKPIYVPQQLNKRQAGRYLGNYGEVSPRPTPSPGFKSLYQLSLMLGKGFSIDDLYLMQENMYYPTKQTLINGESMPFHIVNSPVTVTPLRPSMVPRNYRGNYDKYEASPQSVVDRKAAVSPTDLREMLESVRRRSDIESPSRMESTFGKLNESGKFALNELDRTGSSPSVVDQNEEVVVKSASSVKKMNSPTISNKHIDENEVGADDDEIVPYEDEYVDQIEEKTFRLPNMSPLSIADEIGKNYLDSSTLIKDGDDFINQLGILEEDVNTFELLGNRHKTPSKQVRKDGSKQEIKPPQQEKIIMFAHHHQPVFFDQFSSVSPASEDSTKAMASLTSRVGLEDLSSEYQNSIQLSSEKAYPLSNKITPRSALKTYATAMGKVSKELQRSHTFSTLEAKKKRGKDRLAMSFPTMFYKNRY